MQVCHGKAAPLRRILPGGYRRLLLTNSHVSRQGKAAIIHRDRHCQQREPLHVRHGRRTLPVPPRRRLVQGGGDSDKAYAGIIGVRFGKSPLGLPAWIRAVFHQFQ